MVDYWFIVPITAMGFAAFIVYLDYREKIFLIKRGQYKPSKDEDVLTVTPGLVLIAVGLAITIMVRLVWETPANLIAGLIPLFIGIALTLGYFIDSLR